MRCDSSNHLTRAGFGVGGGSNPNALLQDNSESSTALPTSARVGSCYRSVVSAREARNSSRGVAALCAHSVSCVQ
jgi:hypothetical protein